MNWWALIFGLLAVVCFIWSKYEEEYSRRKKEEEHRERCGGCIHSQTQKCVICKRLYNKDSSMHKYFDDYYDIEEVN